MSSMRRHAMIGRAHHRWVVLCLAVYLLLACGGGNDSSWQASVPHQTNGTPLTDETYRRIRKDITACTDSLGRYRLLQSLQARLSEDPRDPTVHYGLGLVHLAVGNDTLALEHLTTAASAGSCDPHVYRSLAKAARLTDRLSQATMRFEGITEMSNLSPDHALALGILSAETHLWRKADSLATMAAPGVVIRGDALLLKARILRAMGKYEDAFRYAGDAIDLATSRRDHELLARSLDALSMAKRLGGDFPGALKDAETALRVARTERLRYLEPSILADIGFLHSRLGDLRGALDILQEANAAAKELGERTTEAWVIKFLGDIAYETAACDEALDLHYVAKERLSSLNDTMGRAASLTAIANDLACRGDLDGALATYLESLELHRMAGNSRAEATTLGNMAHTYLDQGELGQAVVFFDDAIVRSNDVGDDYGAAEWFLGRGDAHRKLGDALRARSDYKRAYEGALRSGASSLAGRVMGSLGTLDFQEGNVETALSRLREALMVFENLGDATMVGALQQNLAMILIGEGRYEDADTCLRNALGIARDTGSPFLEAQVLVSMGEGALRGGSIDNAAACFTRASELVHDLPASDVLWIAAYGRARCLATEGDFRGSIELYRQALAGLETVQESVHVETWAYGFLSSYIDVYADLIHLLADVHLERSEEGWEEQAFLIAQRAKARAFRRKLAEVRSRRSTDSEYLADPDRELLVTRLSQLSKSLWETSPVSKGTQELRREFDDTERKLAHVGFIGETHEAGVSASVDVDLVSLQNRLRESDTDLLLEYFLAERRSYLWIVTPNRISMRLLPAQETLWELARSYIQEVSRPPRIGTRIVELGQMLASAVFGPEPLTVGQGSRVAIVPDGCLFYVPYEALPIRVATDSTTVLVEDASVFYLPSSAELSLLEKAPRRSREDFVLAVGLRNPGSVDHPTLLRPLRYAEEEAERVCSVFHHESCSVLTGTDATEQRLFQRLTTPCYALHLATHSLIDQNEPRRSCVVLSPDLVADEDGILLMDEIAALEHSPNMVVLSSCQSGIGELIRGEGMIRLSRVFFYAGSRTVVVSLWPVNDRSTLEWMTTFYEHLAAGSRRDEAARAAKMSFLDGRVSALLHPYYWAPFIVIGQV